MDVRNKLIEVICKLPSILRVWREVHSLHHFPLPPPPCPPPSQDTIWESEQTDPLVPNWISLSLEIFHTVPEYNPHSGRRDVFDTRALEGSIVAAAYFEARIMR